MLEFVNFSFCVVWCRWGVLLPAFAANFKRADWNIKSGKGAIALPGHPATKNDTTILPR
jgi:hypothetical protein